MVVRRVSWNRVWLSVCLSRDLFRIWSSVFSKFLHVVWNPYEIVHVRVENFWEKNIFPQKSGNWTKNGPNWNFLDLLENLVINFFSVWSMMNVYVFAAFLHKFHIWEKLISWCMGQNALGQSDCMFLISTMSQEKKDQIAWVFLCWCRFKKSKNWLIFFFFWLGMVKKWLWSL